MKMILIEDKKFCSILLFQYEIKTIILGCIGCVRKTIIILTIIIRIVNKTNAPTVISVGCVNHHEYSLRKHFI